MKFTAKRAPFLAALQLAEEVSDTKSTLPILANVLLRPSKQGVILAATDTHRTVVVTVPAEISEPEEITVPARELTAFVDALGSEEVDVSTTKSLAVSVRGGKARADIPGIAAKDFPKLPNYGGSPFVEMDGPVLRDLIEKPAWSISRDDARQHMSGLHLVFEDGKATSESLNGHCASRMVRTASSELKCNVIVPPIGLAVIGRVIGEAASVGLSFHDDHMFVANGSVIVAAKTVKLEFPSLDQVIPPRIDTGAFDRVAILESLQRVCPFLDGRSKNGTRTSVAEGGGITVSVANGKMKLESRSTSGASAEDEIETASNGSEFRLGINVDYLVNALRSMDSERVVFQFDNGEFVPLVLRPENDGGRHITLIQQMRL